MRKLLLSILLAASFASCSTMKRADYGIIRKETNKSFKAVKRAALKTIKAKGLRVMAVVDHQKNAKGAGLNLPETTVIIFGNPKIGTPLMQNSRSVALDLPQKLLIFRQDGKTVLQYNDPNYLQRRHNLSEGLPQIKKVEKALDGITNGLL